MNNSAARRTPAGNHGHVIALTTLHPTPDDLRLRAVFWRKYLGQESPNLSTEQCRAVYTNCVEMLALADRMERPAPPVQLVARREDALAPVRAARKPMKPAAIGAERFWTLHSDAVRAMVARHGLSWKNDRPDETVEITLPSRLCSYLGPLGGRIRWRRDHRVPGPEYWPGGALPEGVEALPSAPRYDGPMGDLHPSIVRVRLAQQEQIVIDRQMRQDVRLREADERELVRAFCPFYPRIEI